MCIESFPIKFTSRDIPSLGKEKREGLTNIYHLSKPSPIINKFYNSIKLIKDDDKPQFFIVASSSVFVSLKGEFNDNRARGGISLNYIIKGSSSSGFFSSISG